MRILHAWADGAGRSSSIFDVSFWSKSCLHFMSMLMLGELPVNRTRAYFTNRTHLRNFCTSQYCKRACLYCLFDDDTLVLDSEWHWIFDCPHFREVRINLPVLDDKERKRIGTIYKKKSPFEAKVLGSSLVAKNISQYLIKHLKYKSGAWRPLVYCWRGGKRWVQQEIAKKCILSRKLIVMWK